MGGRYWGVGMKVGVCLTAEPDVMVSESNEAGGGREVTVHLDLASARVWE